MRRRTMRALVATMLLAPALPAAAADFLSIAEPGAILYDAPSAKASKRFILAAYTPVEAVVTLDAWVKVRDVSGGLLWVEKGVLTEARMVMVTAGQAVVRREADAGAQPVFSAEKNVVLSLVEAGPSGWAKVRHRDGQEGYVKANEVWGL